MLLERVGGLRCGLYVWFRNIEVLKTGSAIGIPHYQDEGVMEDIHFLNINVEEFVFKSWKPSPCPGVCVQYPFFQQRTVIQL